MKNLPFLWSLVFRFWIFSFGFIRDDDFSRPTLIPKKSRFFSFRKVSWLQKVKKISFSALRLWSSLCFKTNTFFYLVFRESVFKSLLENRIELLMWISGDKKRSLSATNLDELSALNLGLWRVFCDALACVPGYFNKK